VRDDANPGKAIVKAAAELRADVIALATHGRGPLGRALLGSVADKVLRGAVTPVLLQHPIRGPIPMERIESSVTAAVPIT
jgi:nucleotide-binding universal stress UspA family protein